jgi:hypothetical protein
VQMYGPSVILGIASAGAVIGGHSILNKRNLGLMAAYKVVDESYKGYRQRVAKEFGEAKEKELRYPGRSETQVVGQDQEGKDIVDTRPVPWVDGQVREHEVGRWFNDNNKRWHSTLIENQNFLRHAETYWNWRLQAYGHVFLNDIYQALGFEDTYDGQVVGWFKKPGVPCFISFGVDLLENEGRNYHVDGRDDNEYNEGWWLDFNVQGVILDLLISK